MSGQFKHILIVADIEGSSGCWDYLASSVMTPEWARACAAMTLDVSAVVEALFDSGSDLLSDPGARNNITTGSWDLSSLGKNRTCLGSTED